MEYETEEQQLEAIKKWWKENSSLVIIGVAIGISSIFGWQFYQTNQITHAQNASVLYEQVLINSANPAKMSDALASVNELEADFEDTPYASLSALIVAKQQLSEGAFDKAEQQYRWVIENSAQDELMYLAKIRLSRLLLTLKKQDEALALLNGAYPESYHAMVFELKGDVLSVQGKSAEAKIAYMQARILSQDPNRWLQLKIDDLGEKMTKPTIKSATNKPAA
ncbi:Mlr7403 protein [hydrothermal vent metagenome]|uniref:Ancillary SecYEG translocon subunit n=1 Tax=hydrothermal vent metagenome TaxID=652676 RepID=A0A3B0X0U6_9ZZZZ